MYRFFYFKSRFFSRKRGESGDRAKSGKSKSPMSDVELEPDMLSPEQQRLNRQPTMGRNMNPQIKISQVCLFRYFHLISLFDNI